MDWSLLCDLVTCNRLCTSLDKGTKHFKWHFIYSTLWIMDDRIFTYLNLTLVFLYPVAWGAPLISAGLLPLFGLEKISILSGIASIWDTDPFLALVVISFAIAAPFIKVVSQVAIDFWSRAILPKWATLLLARFAMADVFLIALYVAIVKGIGIGRVTTEWGIYLFSACVISSLIVTLQNARTSP